MLQHYETLVRGNRLSSRTSTGARLMTGPGPSNLAARLAVRFGNGCLSPRHVSVRVILSCAAVGNEYLYKECGKYSSNIHPTAFTSSSLQSSNSSLRFHSTVCFQSFQRAPRAFVQKLTSKSHSNISVHFVASQHGCILPHHFRPRRCRFELCSVFLRASPEWFSLRLPYHVRCGTSDWRFWWTWRP
jgi:hypothetical protein